MVCPASSHWWTTACQSDQSAASRAKTSWSTASAPTWRPPPGKPSFWIHSMSGARSSLTAARSRLPSARYISWTVARLPMAGILPAGELPLPHHQHRDAHPVAQGVDRRAEEEVAQELVAVGAHH